VGSRLKLGQIVQGMWLTSGIARGEGLVGQGPTCWSLTMLI